MRIFKYWVAYTKELNIKGIKQLSKVHGGSNVSENEAIKDAENKLLKAQKIINGELDRDQEYEADIVEEIIHKIDDHNIITRNRYGALVLNSKNMLFIDIDDYSKSLADRLFKRKNTKKELILDKIDKIVGKNKYAELGFRVYETSKGYRVLVTNKDFNPRTGESKSIMNDFGSDHLYRWLCIKQNCYRARLTPKPYRIKQKGIKVIYPGRNTEQQQKLSEWIKDYEEKSRDYSTCHLIKEYGKINMNDSIDYHDKMCGVRWKYKLA